MQTLRFRAFIKNLVFFGSNLSSVFWTQLLDRLLIYKAQLASQNQNFFF